MGRTQLADGETYPFLKSKSRKSMRKAPPRNQPEKPLVDLQVSERVPTPSVAKHGSPVLHVCKLVKAAVPRLALRSGHFLHVEIL